MNNQSDCDPAPRDHTGGSRRSERTSIDSEGRVSTVSFDRLRDTLRYQIAGALENAMPKRTHGLDDREVCDTLAGHLEVGDTQAALRMISAGAGRELRRNEWGRVPMCSAHSSALMALNFLAPFVSRVAPDWPCGPVCFERELRVSGVRSQVGPTLDAVISSPDSAVAIETKLAEPWRDRPGSRLSEQYDLPAARVSFNTRAVLDQIRRDELGFEFLDARQLVRHLLGMHSAIDAGTLPESATLLFLYWQPSNPGPFENLFSRLSAECAVLDERLDDQPIRIVAQGTNELLDSWQMSNERWLWQHAEYLRRRYDVTVVDEDD
jgi:hypothetical protein